MKESVITLIANHLLGRKYWVNIVNWRGTGRLEMTSKIHATAEAALQHRHDIESTASFVWVETVTFRSHKDYRVTNITAERL